MYEKASSENAAIASEAAASVYRLEVIRTGIETDPHNYTRFIIISANNTTAAGIDAKGFSSNEASSAKGKAMASVCFCAKNQPGALLHCLSVFQDLDLNMTRLESRPIQGQPWRYMFYADLALENGQDGTGIENAVGKLKNVAEDVRLLGKYYEIN